jgi:exopolyphosphatase/guanosine-5'-triphosphate,3'-diphosphate pyrophosphatase
VVIADETTTITVDGGSFVVPCGALTLGARHIVSDPPQPEELTNAIGEMVDHVDDVKRELPAVLDTTTFVLSGEVPRAMAAVEVGAEVAGDEFVLSREAAEDVFRTLATESVSDRRHNPGLPADLVAGIVGGCCVVIGLIRGLQLDGVTIMMNTPVNTANEYCE